jgi:hypothetical protein
MDVTYGNEVLPAIATRLPGGNQGKWYARGENDREKHFTMPLVF